jgi:hypothetical protein
MKVVKMGKFTVLGLESESDATPVASKGKKIHDKASTSRRAVFP